MRQILKTLIITLILTIAGNIQSAYADENTITAEAFEAALTQPETDRTSDQNPKIVGSDGILYENTAYLSANTLKKLDEKTRQDYYNACEEVIDNTKNGYDFITVMSVDENGKLACTTTFSMIKDETESFEDELIEFDNIKTNIEKKQANSPKHGENISENTEIRETIEVKEEPVPASETLEMTYFDTYYKDADYFEEQLSFNAWMVYQLLLNAAKKGENKINIYDSFSTQDIFDGLNVALCTNVKEFDWHGHTFSIVRTAEKPYFLLERSQFWSPELEEAASLKEEEIAWKAEEYAKKFTPNDIPYGIVEYVDNWICANSAYNYEVADNPDMESAEFFYCHSSYGALLKETAVCESYSKAVTRILDHTDVRNLYVVGTAPGNHAWNHIYINEKWYMLDLTANDSYKNNKDGHISDKTLFLKGSEMFGKTLPPYQALGNYMPSTTLKYPPLSKSDYRHDVENLGSYNKKIKKKKSVKLQSEEEVTEWVSSTPNVVSITKTNNGTTCTVKGKRSTKKQESVTVTGLQNGYPVIAYRIKVK